MSPIFTTDLSIDTEQNLDVYETELLESLELFGIAGIPGLREHQATAIGHALTNEHIFLALATGAGKSLCFQVPAIIQASHHQKVTVVFQPTLEVISSQVQSLIPHGVSVEIMSSLTTSQVKRALAVRLNEGYRPALIYTTTETFFNEFHSSVFATLYNRGAIARFVLDEGHTILHWRHFRETMSLIPSISQHYSGVPITIATASLTLADRDTLVRQLNIEHYCLIAGSLDRPNLIYMVQPVHTFTGRFKIEAIHNFLMSQFRLRHSVQWHLQQARCKPGLIYCATSSHCNDVTKALNKTYGAGYAAAVYGGLDKEAQRLTVQNWIDGVIQVLVATIAFGMGIDKPNVAFVVHYDMPKTLEKWAYLIYFN